MEQIRDNYFSLTKQTILH